MTKHMLTSVKHAAAELKILISLKNLGTFETDGQEHVYPFNICLISFDDKN